MTADDFREELHREARWRTDEITALKNLLTLERDDTRRDAMRKSLVLVLYAHFEGFCVFALEHYLAAVNDANVACREAAPAILAGSWEAVFNAMQHGDEKCKVFRATLPDDRGLHRHWRRRHFVDEMHRFLDGRVAIPDGVIDVESNLKPAVLQRNLFVLGLDHTFVAPHEATINNLLGRRNRIAHGDDRRGVQEGEYAGYEDAVSDIREKLIQLGVTQLGTDVQQADPSGRG